MPRFYSYLQEEDSEDVIAYSFVTDNGSLYYVYFDPYEYNGYTDVYPNLLTLGYGFGFYRSSKGNNGGKDSKVGNTISKIVFDFLEEKGHTTVLLYHCDYSDEKQRGRNKIFNHWYDNSQIQHEILKQTIKVERINEDNSRLELFMGYLTLQNNPKLKEVQNEFRKFAENITSGGK